MHTTIKPLTQLWAEVADVGPAFCRCLEIMLVNLNLTGGIFKFGEDALADV